MNSFTKKYYDLLTGEYSGINLTRITDIDEFQSKQIDDSILPIHHSDIFKSSIDSAELIIDVGFGGGFPLLPLAHIFPEKKFLGIETRGKKVDVVEDIANKLGLTNISFLHARIEKVLIDKETVVTFKAVGKVNDFLSKINSNKKVKVFFYKGPNFYKLEEDQIKNALKSWEIIEEKEIQLPGTEGRLLIGFTNKKVPCGTISSNQLVKVSSIK